MEIAKTLYYRKRCSEAAEILRMVLSIHPTDLVVRTLRMMLLRNMALDTPSHRTAAAVFRQATQEAENIQEHCDFHTEDFYCEYAIDMARRAEEENVGIYAFNRAYSEMIQAGKFIEHMQKALKVIDEEVGGDLSARDDSEIITGPAHGRPVKLFTLNF